MSDIQIKNVSLTYESRDGVVNALSNVSLTIDEGEFVCLIGPSGCGKTTTLNLVAGFLKPTEGDVLIGGKSVHGIGPETGIVFQEYALFPWLTAVKNVEFGLSMKHVPEKQRRETALSFLRLVKLERFANTNPHRLSGGMKQRVAIARALAYDPQVLLLDEPFGALDALTREELQKVVTDVWLATRKTALYVTHNVAEAVYLADRVVVFTDQPGRIKADITIDLPRPRDALSDEFIAYQRRLTALVTERTSQAALAS
jgi:NitT/TauT family transport system ATP-binding protein